MITSGVTYAVGVPGVDIRTWLSGTTTTVTHGVTLDVPAGTYEVTAS